MNNVNPVFEKLLESFAPGKSGGETIRLPGQDRETVKPEEWRNFPPEEQLMYLSAESDGFCRGLQEGYEKGAEAVKFQHRRKMAALEKYLNDVNGLLNEAFR